MKKKILLTGAMGFIGTAVTKRLAKRYSVTVADMLQFGVSAEIRPLIDSGQVTLIETDLSEKSALHDRIAAGEFDWIVHLASLTHIPFCEKYPDIAYKCNVLTLLNIVSIVPPETRLINFSTSSTYDVETISHVEDTSPLRPNDFYGWTKKHAEDLLAYYTERRGLSTLNLRLANAAGFGETNIKLLGTILQQIHQGKTTVELGNLTPRRDFIHIDNIAWVVENFLMQWPFTQGYADAVNLGTGYDSVSVQELFDKIANVWPKPIKVVSVEERKRLRDRELLYVDSSKLYRLLPDYRPHRIDEWLPGVALDPRLRINDQLENTLIRKSANAFV